MRLSGWLGLLLKLFPSGQRQRRAKPFRDRYTPALQVTRLESRCVLNAAPIPIPQAPPPPPATHVPSGATDPNVMVVAAADMLNHSPQTSQNSNVIRLVREGANVDVFLNGAEVKSARLSDISSIDVMHTAGSDTLVIDFSGGNPLPAGGIVFESNSSMAANDSLVIEGGSAQSVNLSMGPSGSGTITIDGTQIGFSGVQSVVDTLHATTLGIVLSDGGQTWSLGDAQHPGEMMLQSSGGTQLTVTEPGSTLLVDTRAAGDNPGDTLQFGNLTLPADSDFTVLGRASDAVNVSGNISLGHGRLSISAGTEYISGTIDSNGGSVTLTAASSVTISASGFIRDAGGAIVIDAGASGTLLDWGIIDASSIDMGMTGGSVDLLGQNVGLTGHAVVDVSGSAGGGAVRIGGDFHGANATIKNAANTYVGRDVTIAANAIDSGSGGTVVLWSEQATMYCGQIQAHGGSTGGDGGRVEISSAGNLAEQGLVDLDAPRGQAGSLLLDPLTITLTHNTSALTDDANLPSILFGSAAVSFTISDFSLSSIAGNITLEAVQTITADADVVVTMTGNHNLNIATQNIAGKAGFIDLSNASFSITGNGSITILGSASGPDACDVTVGALSVANGNISIGTSGGKVTLAGDLNASGTIRVQAKGDVAQSAKITASALGVATSKGSITLTGNNNSVGTFAASDTDAGGAITFIDGTALIIGSVSADPNIRFGITNGITTSDGNVSLASAGSVQVTKAIDAGTGVTGGIVRILAAGAVTETGTVAISASALGVVTTAGDVTLTGDNDVGTFEATDADMNGAITLKDTVALTIGSVLADMNIGFAATTGIKTNDGDVSLRSTTGAVLVNQAIDAGTGISGGIVRVRAAGAVTGTGAISAQALGVATISGSISLTGINDVGTFAASDSASTGAITFKDSAALIIGTVAADPGIGFIAANGISTINGNVSLSSTTGTVQVNQAVNAGTGVSGGIVRIQSFGDVTQLAIISASSLGVASTNGSIALAGNNNVGTFAANDANSGGTILFVDAAALTIGSVAADGSIGFIARTGVTAQDGDISLDATGNLTVSQSVAAGTGTARLVSGNNVAWTNGTVQSQDRLLEASNGIGAAGAAVNVNVSGQFAAELTGAAATGGIFVTQVAAGGDLTIGTVTDLALTSVVGVSTTNNGAIDIETAQGNLNVNADVVSTNALGDGLGSVTLVADANAAAGALTLTIGPNVHIRSGNVTAGAVTLRANDLDIAATAEIHATGIGGGVQLFTATPTVAINIGPTAEVAGTFSVTDGELARIIDADVVTIGKSGIQSGNITFDTVLVPLDQQDTVAGVPVFPDLVVNQTGAGQIVLNDEGTATALNAGTGNITLNAGAGGIVATNGTNGFAELQTGGPIFVLNTTGPIGAPGNPIQFADLPNLLLGVVNIGTLISAQPAAPVFLAGIGTLSLGTINLNSANLDVTAAGNLAVDFVATSGGDVHLGAAGTVSVSTAVDSGSGTIVLRGDSDGDGAGIVTLGPAAVVQSANPTAAAITLQGADVVLRSSPLLSLVEVTAAGGGIIIQSSAPNRPINIGGAAGRVTGINLTDAELAEIVTTPTGTITIGDAAQLGDITFTTALPATTAGAAVVVVQSTAGPGAIILDNSATGGPPVALDGGSGRISLTAGSGGVVEDPGAVSSRADIATTGPSVTINTAGPVGSPTNPIRFADDANSAQQVIDVGTTIPAGQPVYLLGLGTLTLGSITLAGADFDVDALFINVTTDLQTRGGNLTFHNTASAPAAGVRLFSVNPTLGTGRPGGDSGNIDLSNTSVSAASAGETLTIDATSAPGFNGGNISLGQFTGAQVFSNLTARTNVVNSTGTTTVIVGGALSVTGNITLTGQSVVINGPVNSSLAAALRTVDITADNVAINNGIFADSSPAGGNLTIQNGTAGRPIDLGTGVSAGSLNLSTAALGFLHAGLVRIGRNDPLASGNITVSDNIAPADIATLHLFTGGDVGGSGSVAVANLAISAGGSVALGGSNAVATLAGAVAGPSFTFNQAGVISIGTVDGVVGIDAGAGSATFTSTLGFTQTAPITAGLLTVKTLNNAGVPITIAGSANNVALVDLESLNGLGTAPASGAISYSGAGDMRIQKITTVGTATLTSANGSILNGNSSNPNEIAAGLLQLSAARGGIGTPAGQLLTNAASVNALAGNGGVHLVNNASLTIVPIGPANGVTATGGGIEIAANGSLTVGGSVVLNGPGAVSLVAIDQMNVGNAITSTGGGNIVLQSLNAADGDVDLQAHGSISTAGNIDINAAHDFNATPRAALTAVVQTTNGIVTVNAGHAANIAQPSGALSPILPVPGFSIQTGTGLTAAVPPFISASPQFISPDISISVDGTATVVVNFGRSVEQNFTVVVNWGDGKVDTFASMTAGTHVFTHTFSLAAIQSNTSGSSTSQLGGTTAFEPVFTVQGDPHLVFVVAGASATASHQTVVLIAPGLGLVGTDLRLFGSPAFGFFFEPEIQLVAEGPTPALPPGQTSFAVNQSSPGGATAAAADRLLLRTVSTDPFQKEDPENDIDIGEDPNINISELTTETLKVLFGKLPDGRYRIVWYRGTGTAAATERVILDVLLRDGKPINFDDLEKPTVPLKKTDAAGPEARLPQMPSPAESAELDSDPARLESPAAAPVPLPLPAEHVLLAAEATVSAASTNSFAAPPVEDDGAAAADLGFVAGAVLPTAALVEMAHLRQRWNESRVPAPAGVRRSGVLTHAARLYRRLRSKSEQTSTADFD